MSEIETLQEHIKHDQIEYEKQRHEYEQQIDTRKDNVEQLKNEYARLVKDVASKAVFSRSGKVISNQVFLSSIQSNSSNHHQHEFSLHLTLIFIQDWRTPPRNFLLVGIFSLT